ncbi:HEAT repeat domain-containing protein [Alkaliphilus crotonatoxidans]
MSLLLKLNWDDIKNQEDFMVTYLLYQEGKSIDLISRIRNMPPELIKEQLIQAKVKMKRREVVTYHPIFVKLLAGTKKDRITFLEECDDDQREALIAYLIKIMPHIDQAEDKMIALWLAGQLRDVRLLPVIQREIGHKHGGVRRMVCSALRKIPHESNLEILYRGLQDTKPQVRQYAAKALAEVGDEKTLYRINGLIKKPGELDYVKRSFLQTIEIIEARLKEAN